MPAAPALASPGEWASWVADADAVWASVSAQKPAARVASSPRVPDPPRPADAPNRASSSPSHGAAAPLRAVIDAGGFPAFARSTPGTARDEPWPAARLFASGADESVVVPAWSPFSPRFVAPDDECDARARVIVGGPHPRAAAKPRPTFSSPSLIDLRRTSFSIDEAESSIRAVVPSVTPRDDDAAEPRGVASLRGRRRSSPGSSPPRASPRIIIPSPRCRGRFWSAWTARRVDTPSRPTRAG